MSVRTSRAFVVLMVVALLSIPSMPGDAADGLGTGDRAPVPFAEDPVWSDSLDDTSHVYVPVEGLVGVEVSGGDAHLAVGAMEGWIASSVIACPPNYRYDTVHVEADTPGASHIKVTMLDATKEPGEVGYANETVPNFVRRDGPDVSVYNISPSQYPQLRIQVGLYASGADRPALRAWSLYFIDLEVWRDDFVWPGKMSGHRGLNFTDGRLEVNLTSKSGGGQGDYEAFPTVVCSGEYSGVEVFYANAQRTGYDDRTIVNIGGWSNSLTLDDLNSDGYFDLVALMWVGRLRILWGSSSGTWSQTGATTLDHPSAPEEVATGDFNGDGEVDLAVACASGSGDYSYIYLNKGSGTFVDNADITMVMDATRASAGDLNEDGYDDILFSNSDAAKVFLGGPSGPDTTADISFPTANCRDTFIEDIDGDGHLDVILGERNGGKTSVYLGNRTGPDTTADYSLSVTDDVRACEAGDLNGDGYTDLIFYSGSGSSYKLDIFEGGSQGWSDAKRHADITHNDNGNALCTLDLDKDGYEDLLQIQSIGGGSYQLKIWFGGASWPSTPDIVKVCGYDNSVVAVVPKGSGGTRAFRGTFTTEPIYILPDEQKWDILLLEGVMPKNTTVTISILDGTGEEITGWTDLTDWNLDLSSLTGVSPIMVKVTATSELNWTTPVLDRLIVKWMPKGIWREEFYGPAKVERMLSVGIQGQELVPLSTGGTAPQLLFTSVRGEGGYTTKPAAYADAGGLDYTGRAPMAFDVAGTSATDVADVNGDGFLDVVFAVHRTGDSMYDAHSPLFLGSPVGFRTTPDSEFTTTGASDVVLRDLNGDGNVDVVFAQETPDGTNYIINSTLFWGSGTGWNATPDVQFTTNGATGVVAADLDGDGLLDLAFSCYKDAFSTSTESMAFLQGANGFCGTTPSYRLPTKGARGVAADDVDGDGRVDLAFANSFYGGTAELDSWVYWGKAGGGFEATPLGLKTVGADDVKVADLDGDGDLDVVFANYKNNVPSFGVDSYIYLNPGSRTFPTDPSFRLPGTGATAVAVADLDGTGRKDIVIACSYNGTGYHQDSVVYLGGASGWPSTPSFTLPTVGATDAMAVSFIKAGSGGYMSRYITPEDPRNTGTFHTFKYTATLGASQSARLMLIDAVTWAVLAETPLQAGTHEWAVAGIFWVKEHPSIRAVVSVSGLDAPGAFTLDDLWLNWTKRVKTAPLVKDLGLSSRSLYRMTSGTMWVNVTDEYDPVKILRVTVDHRLSGGTGPWQTYLWGTLTSADLSWKATVFPRADAPVGAYDIRVNATDSDGMFSGYVVFPSALTVVNNIPTAPAIRISPTNPVTTSTLVVEVVTPASDPETGALSYHYRWYKDGELQTAVVTDTVISPLTSRAENWSVEVRAYDGNDEGPPATAWAVIGNAGPMMKRQLPNPELKEDTTDDQWINLAGAFEDPDGDPLTWSVSPAPQHITVAIDPATGKVTLIPEANWNGEENITFVVSDGQARSSQTILVTVTAVDDRPVFTTVNGQPITSDPVTFTIKQGQQLVIQLGTSDVEGDALVFSVNTSAVQIDETTGEIRFQPGQDVVGTLRFAVTVAERDNPSVKVKLNFAITVENVNDPPAEPRISNPRAGDKFKAEQNFTLIGLCTDPDTVYGQELNFSWSANGSLLGYGSSLTVSFKRAGTYNITLTVSDGEFSRTASIEITIEAKEIPTPPPPPDGDGDHVVPPYALIVGAIVALCIVFIMVFMLLSRRRAEGLEAKDESEEKREAFKQMAAEVRATADLMEIETGKATLKPRAGGVKTQELEEVVMEQRGPGGSTAVVTAKGMEERMLTMKPQETAAASKETEQLFKDMGRAEPVVSAEEQEWMRVDNLKRKYANAIGRLPYGIPAAELKGRDWNELAALLAAGQKRTLPDGKEVTAIAGRWYYSDPGDSSSFLKEHGAKPRAEARRAAPAMDRAVLLAKLEERFILGEISEEAYKELKRKFTQPPTAERATTKEWIEEE